MSHDLTWGRRFLMCPPEHFDVLYAINPWMDVDVTIDHELARRQWDALVAALIRAGAEVELLDAQPGLPDLVFTANLGIVLGHLENNPVVISNFESEPRRGETEVGVRFFESMGYEVAVSPHKFEGEAELKHLHDNVYAGGYGQRSEREAYEWMERTYDMTVVKLRETDPYLYHLDCSVFPITDEDTLVCTELFEREEVAELERHTNIIDVGADECFAGICNSVRLSNTILSGSHLQNMQAGTEEYAEEIKKNRRLEDIAAQLAMEVGYFNLAEYHKGGALLSCMVMHLNRYSYAFKLV